MRMAAAELFQLALKLHDWFGNGRCALSPAQDQPSSPADSTYQAQLNGVTHACPKLTLQPAGSSQRSSLSASQVSSVRNNATPGVGTGPQSSGYAQRTLIVTYYRVSQVRIF